MELGRDLSIGSSGRRGVNTRSLAPEAGTPDDGVFRVRGLDKRTLLLLNYLG